MSNSLYPDPVVLVADDEGNGGTSPVIELSNGTWELWIYAGTGGSWDAGNGVQLQMGPTSEGPFSSVTRPPNHSETYSLTANEEPVTVTTGGSSVRLRAPTIGTNSNITLLAKYVGPAA